jgi:DNA-binding transcriptional MerR regulator
MIHFIKETFSSVFSYLNLENGKTEQIPDPIVEKAPKKYEDKYLDLYQKTESTLCSHEKIEGLKNSILMENTPLGNVIMYYDKSRETFIYYSDSNIPYRYLEVISRKYVSMNDCKQIHVDMDQEIKDAHEKLEQKKQEEEEKKKQLEQQLELQKTDENHSSTIVKKDVFAKLKKYNTNTSLKSSGIPTDNKSISKKNIQETNKPMILKENANRYSREGKLVNFSFLKKIDKKVVDKRYAMSFSDFKNMITPSLKK